MSRINRNVWVSLVLVSVTVAAGLETVIATRKVNFEKFHDFEFEQRPLLGFCPQLGGAYQASIRRQASGRYLLDMSVVEEGDPQTDDCADLDFVKTDCGVIRSIPPRELTETEAAQVRRIFRSVKIRTIAAEAFCSDPCRVVVARWDQSAFEDIFYGCGPDVVEVIDAAKVDEILAPFGDLGGHR